MDARGAQVVDALGSSHDSIEPLRHDGAGLVQPLLRLVELIHVLAAVRGPAPAPHLPLHVRAQASISGAPLNRHIPVAPDRTTRGAAGARAVVGAARFAAHEEREEKPEVLGHDRALVDALAATEEALQPRVAGERVIGDVVVSVFSAARHRRT